LIMAANITEAPNLDKSKLGASVGRMRETAEFRWVPVSRFLMRESR
jgi:hypothetical protein